MDGAQTRIHGQLEELANLWMDASAASLQQVTVLCGEIEATAAHGDFDRRVDRNLLRRVEQLATGAEKRLAECLTIQSRTGTYSVNGSLELLTRVATSGWEG